MRCNSLATRSLVIAWALGCASLGGVDRSALAQTAKDPVAQNDAWEDHVLRRADGTPVAQHESGHPAVDHTIYLRVVLCQNGDPSSAWKFSPNAADGKTLGLQGSDFSLKDPSSTSADIQIEHKGNGAAVSVWGKGDGTLTYKLKDANGNVGTIVLKVHFIDCSTRHARGYDSPRLETAMLVVPGQPAADGVLATAYVALDRTEWCKFGPAAAVAMALIPTDEDGTPITPGIPVADNTPTTPLADNTPNADNAPTGDKPKDDKAPGADTSASDDSGVVLKGDENWTWDPKDHVYVNKKDATKKLPVPKTVKKGQMWDPDGDPEGLSPIEPETSGNSRTYRDPKTGKNILVLYVLPGGLVYERRENYGDDGNPQLVRVYDDKTGKLQERRTTDPKTGIRTMEKFDQDGKPTNVSTFKDNQQLTNEEYKDGKLVKRTTFWPGTDKIQKVEEDFDGGKPKKTTNTPLVPEPGTPPVKTATEPPQQPDTVQVFDKTAFTGTDSGTALPSETVALLYPKPGLPGTGTRQARDTGFDRDPAKCTTNAEGRCEIEIQQDDRQFYGLATSSTKPNHYRLDFNSLQHSGGVAKTTGKRGKSELPAGGTTEEFKIGNDNYARLGFDQPENKNLIEQASRALGAKVETDRCERTKPAQAGDMQPASFSAINNALPATTIKLGRADAAGRRK